MIGVAIRNPREVYTPVGKGKAVYVLADGTVVVEFPHGGGMIFHVTDLFYPNRVDRSQEVEVQDDGRSVRRRNVP